MPTHEPAAPMIPRCCYCTRRLWPWQRQGWLVGLSRTWRWHGRCRRLALEGAA